ncbi:Phenylacetic acid degradation protein PaaD, thioesterase [Candidatus Rhodobacter oscarellae]|uniref:Medium/long-chain acyl-CoA thioesterase YigI n=1 Tax=Candidatus Rhodobacter oscarellae TaxID=1675527 RepID=A0A0J9E9M3_9RHOB|nr:PaaI family thioesterase [Candidatus Rhodobacter lobularis]KMW59485.1 Phenylacetic acid degradation protein PaaD, thioesterase [Candidatus Rhodobacter lobularis]
MSIEQKIRASFDRQAMMATIGAELASVSEGQVVLRAPILESVTQQHGFAHAAVSFALGDSAAGYAALSVMPEDAEVLTAEMKINLLAPAAGDRLEATGHVIRAGRKLVVVGASVVAFDGGKARDVAVLQGTMVPFYPS